MLIHRRQTPEGVRRLYDRAIRRVNPAAAKSHMHPTVPNRARPPGLAEVPKMQDAIFGRPALERRGLPARDGDYLRELDIELVADGVLVVVDVQLGGESARRVVGHAN